MFLISRALLLLKALEPRWLWKGLTWKERERCWREDSKKGGETGRTFKAVWNTRTLEHSRSTPAQLWKALCNFLPTSPRKRTTASAWVTFISNGCLFEDAWFVGELYRNSLQGRSWPFSQSTTSKLVGVKMVQRLSHCWV